MQGCGRTVRRRPSWDVAGPYKPDVPALLCNTSVQLGSTRIACTPVLPVRCVCIIVSYRYEIAEGRAVQTGACWPDEQSHAVDCSSLASFRGPASCPFEMWLGALATSGKRNELERLLGRNGNATPLQLTGNTQASAQRDSSVLTGQHLYSVPQNPGTGYHVHPTTERNHRAPETPNRAIMRSEVNKRPAANNGWAHIGKIAVGHCSVVLYPQTSQCLSMNRPRAAPLSVYAKHQTKNPRLHNLCQRPPSGTVRSNAVHQVHPKAVITKCHCILVHSRAVPRTPDNHKT